MKKFIPTLMLLGAGVTIGLPQASAETAPAARPAAVKKTPAKAQAKETDNENQPDVAGHTRVDFNCELGNKITVYENTDDNKRIGVRWNKKLHELTRVETTTGAHRFENKDTGLVWINIPAKGMLLDSKKGQQLANECRNPEQTKAKQAKA